MSRGTRRPQSKKSSEPKRNRVYTVFGIFGLIAVLMIGKLLYIQVLDAGNLQKKARQLRNPSLVLYNRGRILDRNGVVLAQDTLLYDVFAHPQYYWKVQPVQIAQALSPILQKSYDDLRIKLSEPISTIGIVKNLHKAVVDQILAARITMPRIDAKTKQPILDESGQVLMARVPIPGLDFVRKTVRNYPQGSLAAHVLGYVNDEAQLSSGIEETAKDVLKQAPQGIRDSEFNGRGEFINLEKVSPENLVTLPKAEDVALTVDSRLQYIAERELAKGLERTKAKRGTVIMMDPKTGEILAFAVLPTYQPEQFLKAPPEALKNWAISDVYPPGSTFKILTVACGLESGAITPETKFMDTGRMKIGGWTIQNYDYGKHGAPGLIDLVYLFQHSSNIASAKVSMLIPTATHRDLLKRFGMGAQTAIDLPGESAGILRPLKDWDLTTHATIGFGYGLASTPMQMAAAIAAIANKGVWITPHLLKHEPHLVHRRVLSEKTAKTVTELLATSIETAKTSTVRLEGFRLAGKTGTSRKPKENGRGYDTALFTSFVGYFPAEDPRLLMMVVIDSPGIGEAWGSTVAGPIFKDIAEESISYLGLKPAKITLSPPTGVDSPKSKTVLATTVQETRHATANHVPH